MRSVHLEDAKVPLPNSLRIRVPLETANESTVDALHTSVPGKKGRPRCCLTWNARAISWS